MDTMTMTFPKTLFDLPLELTSHIFDYLDLETLITTSSVSKVWYFHTKTAHFFKESYPIQDELKKIVISENVSFAGLKLTKKARDNPKYAEIILSLPKARHILINHGTFTSEDILIRLILSHPQILILALNKPVLFSILFIRKNKIINSNTTLLEDIMHKAKNNFAFAKTILLLPEFQYIFSHTPAKKRLYYIIKLVKDSRQLAPLLLSQQSFYECLLYNIFDECSQLSILARCIQSDIFDIATKSNLDGEILMENLYKDFIEKHELARTEYYKIMHWILMMPTNFLNIFSPARYIQNYVFIHSHLQKLSEITLILTAYAGAMMQKQYNLKIGLCSATHDQLQDMTYFIQNFLKSKLKNTYVTPLTQNLQSDYRHFCI